MRRNLIIVIVIILSSGNLGGDERPFLPYDLQTLVVDFEHRHDPFVRELFGCPATGVMSDDVCFPRQGRVDAGMFKRARKAAASLYGLKE